MEEAKRKRRPPRRRHPRTHSTDALHEQPRAPVDLERAAKEHDGLCREALAAAGTISELAEGDATRLAADVTVLANAGVETVQVTDPCNASDASTSVKLDQIHPGGKENNLLPGGLPEAHMKLQQASREFHRLATLAFEHQEQLRATHNLLDDACVAHEHAKAAYRALQETLEPVLNEC